MTNPDDGERPTSSDYDAIGHSSDGSGDVHFEVGTNYGHGQPHYYVCLDAGQVSCWLEPEQAMKLGRRLLDLAERTAKQNLEGKP